MTKNKTDSKALELITAPIPIGGVGTDGKVILGFPVSKVLGTLNLEKYKDEQGKIDRKKLKKDAKKMLYAYFDNPKISD